MTFSSGKVNAGDAKELEKFNKYLSEFSYVNGYTPTQEDATALKSFTSAPAEKFPHVLRWFKHISSFTDAERKNWPNQGSSNNNAKDAKDDDFDLFGSDSEGEDEEKKRITQERLKAYAEKKAKKPGPIAKSTIIYDIRPWDDSISIDEIEKNVRKIEKDGLLWGNAKIEPLAYGIKKLQICCVIEDDKVSSDWLEEEIMAFEDLVQSVDIVAFNKV